MCFIFILNVPLNCKLFRLWPEGSSVLAQICRRQLRACFISTGCKCEIKCMLVVRSLWEESVKRCWVTVEKNGLGGGKRGCS